MSDLLLGAIGTVGVLVGLLGVVVPALPGLVVLLLTASGTLLAQQGGPFTWTVVALLVALTIAGSVCSAVLPARSAAASGAPRSTLMAGLAGALVGFFVLPVLGLLLGGVGGLLLAEHRRLEDWGPAWASARGVLRAYGLGVLLELGIGVVMAALWLVVFVTRAA